MSINNKKFRAMLFNCMVCCTLLNICFQVIIEKHPTSDLQDIDRRRFIVPDQITFAELLYIIRRRIHLPSEKTSDVIQFRTFLVSQF